MVHNPLRQVGEAVKGKIENRRTRVRARAALSVTGCAVCFPVLFTFCACRAVCQKAVPLCRAIHEKIVSSPCAARVMFPCRAGVAGSSFSPSHLAPPCPPLPPPPPSPISNASSMEKKWSGKRSGRWEHLCEELHFKRKTLRKKVSAAYIMERSTLVTAYSQKRQSATSMRRLLIKPEKLAMEI